MNWRIPAPDDQGKASSNKVKSISYVKVSRLRIHTVLAASGNRSDHAGIDDSGIFFVSLFDGSEGTYSH